MMKQLAFSLSLILISFSCNKNLQDNNINDVLKDSQTVNTTDMTIEKIPEMCYFDDMKNDTVYLKVVNNLGTITGQLRYKNAKTKNATGEIMGFMSGDTLKLDYLITENGTMSSKEIWFLKKNEKLVEGIGAQDADGRYTNARQVVFEGGHSLQAADCAVVEKNLK